MGSWGFKFYENDSTASTIADITDELGIVSEDRVNKVYGILGSMRWDSLSSLEAMPVNPKLCKKVAESAFVNDNNDALALLVFPLVFNYCDISIINRLKAAILGELNHVDTYRRPDVREYELQSAYNYIVSIEPLFK